MGILKSGSRTAKTAEGRNTTNPLSVANAAKVVTVNTGTGRLSISESMAKQYLAKTGNRIGVFVENDNELGLGGTKEMPKIFIFFSSNDSITYTTRKVSVESKALTREIANILNYNCESGRFKCILGDKVQSNLTTESGETEVDMFELLNPTATAKVTRTITPEMIEKRKATLANKKGTTASASIPTPIVNEVRQSPFRR